MATRVSAGVVMVTDDFLALIVANRLGVSCQLFVVRHLCACYDRYSKGDAACQP
jgi:hypothetical protein